MQRVTTQRHAEAVGRALACLGPRMRDLSACDVFCGDPVFAGLHDDEAIVDGRSYRTTAHVLDAEYHGRDGRSTVVLATPEDAHAATVLHELGHVAHFELERRLGRPVTVAAVTEYARRDRFEAFAEAFLAWLYPADQLHLWWPAARVDPPSRELLDRLARGGW